MCVMHGEAEAEAQQLTKQLQQLFDLEEVPLYELPPAVLVHAAPACWPSASLPKSPPPDPKSTALRRHETLARR